MAGTKRGSLMDALYPVITILLAGFGWEVLTRISGTPSYVLPAPSAVIAELIRRWSLLLENAVPTTVAILSGFSLSILVGLTLGVLIASVEPLEKSIYPLLVGSQAVPKIALAPLFVVWFGFGVLPKVLITMLIAFFPIVINTVTGLRSVEPETEFLARSMGLSQFRTFRMIRLYVALPSIFSGLKVAITLAVVGTVVGEFVGSDRGLGNVLIRAISLVNTPLLFATLIVLTVLAILLFAGVEFVERLVIRWHVSQRSKSI